MFCLLDWLTSFKLSNRLSNTNTLLCFIYLLHQCGHYLGCWPTASMRIWGGRKRRQWTNLSSVSFINFYLPVYECHKTGSRWNHITTDHKEGEQLEDRRNVGENSCKSGDVTDQTGPVLDVYDDDDDLPVFKFQSSLWRLDLLSFQMPILQLSGATFWFSPITSYLSRDMGGSLRPVKFESSLRLAGLRTETSE